MPSVSTTNNGPAAANISVPIEEATRITRCVLEKAGHSRGDAALITKVIMWAQQRGNNQSLVKIPTGAMNPSEGAVQRQCSAAANDTDSGDKDDDHDGTTSVPTIEFESHLGIKLNGNLCPGIVGLSATTDHVLRKVKAHGMAIGALHGICSGTGPIGYYARRIAEEGFVGLVLCQSPELMAPHGGFKALYGTNPIAYGIPRCRSNSAGSRGRCHSNSASSSGRGCSNSSDCSLPPPIVFDAAMSAISYFGLHELHAAGKPVPDGIAFDVDGNETRDAAKALAGALRVFDNGHKGSHLAMMVELLGGALGGGDVEDKKAKRNWGTTVIAIDPNILGDGEGFLAKVEAFVDRYKAQPLVGETETETKAEQHQQQEQGNEKVNTKKRLMLPGERSEELYRKSVETGCVEVISTVWDAMLKLAE